MSGVKRRAALRRNMKGLRARNDLDRMEVAPRFIEISLTGQGLSSDLDQQFPRHLLKAIEQLCLEALKVLLRADLSGNTAGKAAPSRRPDALPKSMWARWDQAANIPFLQIAGRPDQLLAHTRALLHKATLASSSVSSAGCRDKSHPAIGETSGAAGCSIPAKSSGRSSSRQSNKRAHKGGSAK